MLIYYSVVVLTYLLYQAAFGGLFFVLVKSNTQNPLIASTFLMIEPILMILLGIQIANFVDELRKKLSPYFYVTISSLTLLSIFFLFLIQYYQANFAYILLSYSLAVVAFIGERIYRQRLPRDFSNTTLLAHGQINAIANLGNRGAPILAPLVLYLFPNGLTEKYLFSFVIISIISTICYCKFSKKLICLPTIVKPPFHHDSLFYPMNNLGLWHVWHLSLMNFVLGGLFMVLSQSVLISNNIINFLQGPSVYFFGFWVTMLLLIVVPRKKILTPFSGLCFTAALGAFLMISSIGGVISVFALALAGICYGFAINFLGTFIQSQLEHGRYSYYETRAQICGRISMLMGLLITGYALDAQLTTDILRGIMGVGTILGAGLLAIKAIPIVAEAKTIL